MRITLKYALIVVTLGGGCVREGTPLPDSGNAQASTIQRARRDAEARGQTPDSRPEQTQDSRLQQTPDSRRRILFAGTSITAGLGLDPDDAYPNLVQQKIDSAGLPYEIVNAGYSGETSSGLLRRLDWLLRAPFDVIVIETGANDGLRGIPVASMRENIQLILDKVKATRPEAQLILVQMEALPNLGRAYTQGFHDVFPELARRNNVPLLPFLLDGVAGVRRLNQGDGIHPNEEGARIVAENVWRGLKPHLR